MARYTGPKARQYRALGLTLGTKTKCATIRRPFRPGQHGQARVKLSEYGIRLKEKQKVRVIYGVLEKQFRRYFEKAAARRGVTGDIILQMLEQRLDNVIYRLGLARTRPQARQFVSHKFFIVDGSRVNIASFTLKPGMTLQIHPKKVEFFKKFLELNAQPRVPSWLEWNEQTMTATVNSLPNREENDTPVNMQLIVEFYSR